MNKLRSMYIGYYVKSKFVNVKKVKKKKGNKNTSQTHKQVSY